MNSSLVHGYIHGKLLVFETSCNLKVYKIFSSLAFRMGSMNHISKEFTSSIVGLSCRISSSFFENSSYIFVLSFKDFISA